VSRLQGADLLDVDGGQPLAGIVAGLTPEARSRVPQLASTPPSTTPAADAPIPSMAAPGAVRRGFGALAEFIEKSGDAVRHLFDPSTEIVGDEPVDERTVFRGLADGDFRGLEALEFGAVDGRPAVAFTDSRGERQVIPLSEPQWMAALEHRTRGRERFELMAQEQMLRERVVGEVEATLGMMQGQVPDGLARALRMQARIDPERALQSLAQVGTSLGRDGGRSLATRATAEVQSVRRTQILRQLLGQEESVEVRMDAQDFEGLSPAARAAMQRAQALSGRPATKRTTRRVGGLVNDYDQVMQRAFEPTATAADRLRAFDLQALPTLVVDPSLTKAFDGPVGFFDVFVGRDDGSDAGPTQTLMRLAAAGQVGPRVPEPADINARTVQEYAADLHQWSMDVLGHEPSDPTAVLESVVRALARRGRIPTSTVLDAFAPAPAEPQAPPPSRSTATSSAAVETATNSTEQLSPARSLMRSYLQGGRP
jgi:hypothetical protein